MKRTAFSSPKLIDLMLSLNISKPTAVGILELLWEFTYRNAIQGDVGKWKNRQISYYIGWDGDDDILIQALIDCRWLDEDEEHRLIIHDLADHADDNWRKTLEKLGLKFIDGSPTRKYKINKNEIKDEKDDENFELISNQSRTNLEKNSRVGVGEVVGVGVSESESESEVKPLASSFSNDSTDNSKILFQFPCTGKQKNWNFTEKVRVEYAELYPQIDVLAETMAALAWIKSNSMKTAQGMKRFLNRWYTTANDRCKFTPRASPVKTAKEKRFGHCDNYGDYAAKGKI